MTSPDAARKTLACHRQAFYDAGVGECWTRVIGLVVQPGVEFDHTGIIDYQSEKAQALSQVVNDYSHLVLKLTLQIIKPIKLISNSSMITLLF